MGENWKVQGMVPGASRAWRGGVAAGMSKGRKASTGRSENLPGEEEP